MTRLIGDSRNFARRFEILALTLLLAGAALPAAARAAAEESEEARSPALPLPAAGTRLSSRSVMARPLGVVDLRTLARQPANLARAVGPLVGQEMPEPMEMEEPEAPATSTFHASLVESPQVSSPGALKSFAGLDDIAKQGSSTIVIPPDVDGAVGLTKLMECLNNNYRVFDKSTGNVLSTVSISLFWSPTGFSNTVFDPKVLYDPYNDRWLLTAVANAGLPGASIMLGISQTGDPEGVWSLFAIDADATDANWADFPTIGFNKNWVAINVNLVTIAAPQTIVGSECAVINYPTLRTGSATGTIFSGTGFVSSPAATYSTTENTLYVPTHLSSGSGTYRVDTITGTAAAPVYTIGATRSRGLTWTQPSGQLIPQAAPLAGTSVCGAVPCKIETQDAQIRSTPVFRNGSLYYTQTVVPSGTSHTAAQWTRVDPVAGTVLDGGRIEDPSATSANGGKWYAYPHIAVNGCGDVIVGYSQFSSAQYPAAGYSFRFGTDAAGTMRDPVITKPGEDYYHKDFGSGRNRWGDYSKAQVDPSDDQSLWVLQEYAKLRQGTDDGTSGSNASRWGTWWAKVGPGVSMGGGPVATEGNTGTKDFNFTVLQSMPVCAPVTVGYTVNPGSATLADNDYQTPGSSVIIPANNTSATITVKVIGDTKRESDETFSVTITSVSVGEVGLGNTATATITNDDPIPTISIADLSANEGDAGTTEYNLPVTLSNPSDQTITVSYATQDGSATLADNDYSPGGGTLTFTPGTTGPQSATFNANGDTKTESDEIVVVNLSSPANATIADGTANATLLNDDGPPSVSIDDVSVAEGNTGPTSAGFTISLNHTSDQPVSVSYQTNDGTATISDGDYAAVTGTANFPPGALSMPVSVTVNGDTRCEPNETFFVTLSAPSGGTIGDGTGQGTITNDDECDSPQVTVLAPNGGEYHYLGEAVDFTWNATDNIAVTSVDLRLSRDGGGSYEDVALGEANDGLYTWTATGPVTDQALLQVTAHDGSGNTGVDVSDAVWHVADVVDVPPQAAVTEFALGPARPNPSRGEVSIGYDLPRAARVKIEILDVQGRVLAVLVSGEVAAGRHAVRWRPERSVPSGLFFARARLGGKVMRERFVVTR
jgi:Calx-beta domain-containing protein/Big-like domain-containing protein